MTGGLAPRCPVGRRWIAVVAAVLVLGGACSDGGGTTEPRTLRVLMTDDWVTPPFLDAVRDFEAANEGVRVVVDKKPISTMLDDLASGILGDSHPDVVQNHAFAAGSRGLARPVDDLWKKHLKDDEYFPGALDDVMWAGRHYGVPLDTNALVMVYNADLLRAAGVTPPSGPMTFADFEALARAVTSPDGSRRAIGLGTSIFRAYGWVAAGGGSWLRLAPDGTPAFSLDSPESIEGLAFMAGLVGKGLAFAPVPPGTGSSSVYALFESGTTVFQATGSWDMARLRKSRPDVEFGVLPMPRSRAGPDVGTSLGGSSLFIAAQSKQAELAFDFMLHVTGDDYALRLAEEEGRLPVRPRVYSDPFFDDPVQQTMLAELEVARPHRLDAFPTVSAALSAGIDQILREQKDPQATLAEVQRQAVASLGTS